MSWSAQLYKILCLPLLGYPLLSYLSAFFIAFVWLGWRHRGHSGRWGARAIMRALFPSKFLRAPSARVDIAFAVMAALVFPLVLSYFIITNHIVEVYALHFLHDVWGEHSPLHLPLWCGVVMQSFVMFIVYEWVYWLDHFLSHRIGFLWAFHRVHHTAHMLSPLTNFRVHPIDTIVFGNLLALAEGCAQAGCDWLNGTPLEGYTIGGVNLFIFFGLLCLGHLQHTQVWIAFRGPWGKIFISPAHHQLHHSEDPQHYDCNYGSFLALWDYLAGTLIVPDEQKGELRLGVRDDDSAGSVVKSLVVPFKNAAYDVRDRAAAVMAWVKERYQPHGSPRRGAGV
jgi:sterol desaturase/sphingolipid hydroxylase (fatty acid hydroxylase superfamily)